MMSLSRLQIHRECLVVCPSAMYSAWHIELATVTKRQDTHMIGLPYSFISMPYVDWELGLPQFVSAKHSTGCVTGVVGNILRTQSFVPAR